MSPKKGGREEETNLVGSVVGITTEDRGVVRGEDKWSFGRGGVFVVGGVTTSKRIRPLLQFPFKRNWGTFRSFGKNGHIASMCPIVHGWERGVLLDHDGQKDGEEDVSSEGDPEKAPLAREDREQRSVCTDGIAPRFDLHHSCGRKYHLTKDCPTLAASRVIKERMVCQQCEHLKSSTAQDGHMTCRTARSAPVR